MSRTRAFVRNSAASAILQIVRMATAFVLPRIMLTAYGSEINGLVSSIRQFIGYFGLLEAGLAQASIYALYRPLAKEDHPEINGVLTSARRLYNQSGYVFVALTLVFAGWYALSVDVEALASARVFLLVGILGFGVAVDFFTMAKYRVLLTADQRLDVLSVASIVSVIVNTGVFALAALSGWGIVAVEAAALSAVLLRSLILSTYVKRHYPYVDYHGQPADSALDRRWDALYLRILGVVQTGAPVVLATVFLDLRTVSVYAIYDMVMGGIDSLLSIFRGGLTAGFGDVIATQSQAVVQQTYQEFEFAYYGIICWAYLSALILIRPFIRIYTAGVTDAQYDLPVFATLIVLNGLIYNLKTPQGTMVISAGLFRETRWQTTAQAAILVLGGALFVQWWGLAGIMVGSILSNLYRVVDLVGFIPKHVTHLPARQSWARIARLGLCAILTIGPWAFVQMRAASYAEWGAWAMAASGYALLVVVVVNRLAEPTLFAAVTRRLRRVFGRAYHAAA